MKRLFLICLLLSDIAHGDHAVPLVSDNTPSLKLQRNFPATRLRGYGALSGKCWTDAAGGSLLQIDCQDIEHARLGRLDFQIMLVVLAPSKLGVPSAHPSSIALFQREVQSPSFDIVCFSLRTR